MLTEAWEGDRLPKGSDRGNREAANYGHYSESKISLEVFFNRWSSKRWGEYLWLVGAVIGPIQHDPSRQEVETHCVRTFSAKEMAFNILEPMHLILFSIMQVEPVWGDLSGGFDQITDLADVVAHVRANINKKAKLRHAIARDNATEFKVINGAKADRVLQIVNITPRANFRFEFPDLLRHILSTRSLNYVTLSVSIKPSLSRSLALVKLGHRDLLASDGRWK
ncbi:hypothetical protein BGW80DRAFT_1463330 [Lactifluus volemus]|nr:hypothetical protein BGW80DRAFT_1463330 [Lactifluus volemus]